MPLLVKEFSWNQTEEQVIIRVPLKGVPSSNVDIFTTDNYIKANFPPFLFEVFLYSNVNENGSKCTLSDDEIIFELQKTVPEIWDNLSADITKLEMLEKRKSIIEKQHEKTKEQHQERKEKLAKLQRLSVQQQIDQDTKNRKFIDERRNAERTKVMNDLEEWRACQEKKTGDQTDCQKADIFDSPTPSVSDTEEKMNETPESPEKVKHPLVHITPIDIKKEKSKDIDIFPVPLPRNPGTITVSFTHRDFPTPSRESQAPQEEEWLKKQVEARRATGFVAEDLRPEECNPTWLKDKGDSFYKVGNYLGAVSAYSHAIKLGSKMPTLYSNRSAAHFGLGNLHKALDDCSQAIELMTPHVAANAEGRARCHARRGAVLCKLGLPEAGLADFEEALKLRPKDPKLLEDIEQAKFLIRNPPMEKNKVDGLEIIETP